jgi:hypothetical protein
VIKPSVIKPFVIKPFVILIALYVAAGVGLTTELLLSPNGSVRLLSLALLLLGADQARMAIVDLQNIQAVSEQIKSAQLKHDPRLTRFSQVTISKIGLELIGLYLAWWNLGWGGLGVMCSQIWFNSLAGVQLNPHTDEPIQPWGIRDRSVILIADIAGLGLILLWIRQIAPLVDAIGLLAMVLLYGLMKYGHTVRDRTPKM